MIQLVKPSKKSRFKLWLLSALGFIAVLIFSTSAAKKEPIIFKGDFEKGNFSGWEQEFCCPHSGEIVNSPTRAGKYAAKFTLNRNDPIVERGKRSEVKRYGVSSIGSEYWYGFSIYVPHNWVEDTAGDIVTQWHPKPDLWLGERWRGPTLVLTINGNKWGISNNWDPKIVTKKDEVQGREVLWSNTLTKGAWTDWVFHIKWSYKSDGLLEAWKDGELIVDKHGPNTYNDFLGPFLKIGTYKYPWKSGKPASVVNQRVIYYDEVRVGNESASYTDVAPGF